MLVTDPQEILELLKALILVCLRRKEGGKKDDLKPSENRMNTILENLLMPRLSVKDSQVCEGCVKNLSAFESNKSPGNGG